MHSPDPATTMRRLMGLGVGLAAVLQGITPLRDLLTPDLHPLAVVGLAVLLAAHVLTAAAALFDLRLHWPVAAVTSVGMWLTGLGMMLGGELIWHSNLWVWTVLMYLVLLRRGSPGPWITLVALELVPTLILLPRLEWRQQVLDISFTAVAVVVMLLAHRIMESQLTDMELSVADDVRRRTLEHRTRLLENTRKENIRLVHDTLLHLFQQVASGRGEITPAEVKRLGEESRKGLGTTDLEASPLQTALEEAVADVGCPVALRIEDSASLPAKVTRHVADATREAVRNVARHVPGGTAQVTARVSVEGCRVVISDWGPGFDPAEVPRSRMGIREGIHGRMAEVGGHATIRSDIVGGTAVTLTWQPIPHAARIGPSGRRWLSLVTLPGLVGTAGLLLLLRPTPGPLIAWGLFALTAVLMLLLSRLMRRRGLHIHEAVLANLWGIGLLAANYAWLPPDADHRYSLWTVGLTSSLMILTIPGRRWKEAAGLVVANIAAALAGAYGLFGRPLAAPHEGSLSIIVITGVVTLALTLGTSAVSRRAHASHADRTEQQLAEQIQSEQVAEQEAWITALDRICGPLFTGLYTGAVHPADPAVQVEARHVESRLRDALRLWPDGTHLATALDRLRRTGWSCLLDVEEVESVEATRFAVLLNQLDPATPGQHLTITRRGGTLVATVAEPGLSEMRQARLSGARILLTDPDFTQFSCEEDKP